jgi:hypothetical protein
VVKTQGHFPSNLTTSARLTSPGPYLPRANRLQPQKKPIAFGL